MAWPHPQRWQDWTTQAWNIAWGRRLRDEDGWLLGPRGEIGGIGDLVVAQVAAREGLSIERDAPVGLVESFEPLGAVAAKLDSRVGQFYVATPGYELDVWSKWEAGWSFPARAVDRLFARRIAQLCLPMDPLETIKGITSEVIALRAPDGTIRHRVWLRRYKATGETIYSGFYGLGRSPAGETFVKVVFPLPKGSATVIMRATARPDGGLRLASDGQDGDAGFYFIVEDRRGGLWVHHLRCFREFIEVYAEAEGILRADHWMTLWGRRVYTLHYRIRELPARRRAEQRTSVQC